MPERAVPASGSACPTPISTPPPRLDRSRRHPIGGRRFDVLLVLTQIVALTVTVGAFLPGSPLSAAGVLAGSAPLVMCCTTLALARQAGSARGQRTAPARWLLTGGYAAATAALACWILLGHLQAELVVVLATAGRLGQLVAVVLLRGLGLRIGGLDLLVVIIGASAIGVVVFELVLAGPAWGTGAAAALPSFIWLPLVVDVAVFVLTLTVMTVRGARSDPHLLWPATGLVMVAAADLVSFGIGGAPALITALSDAPDPHPGAGTVALLGHAVASWGPVLTGLRPSDLLRRSAALRTRLPRSTPEPVGDTPGALLLIGCSALVAVCLLVPQVPRSGALIGLICLVAALFRSREALRADRARTPGSGADTDALTGLASRGALAAALAGRAAVSAAATEPGGRSPTTLLLVDLDNFKDVNEALGHECGDRLLTAVGNRLRGVLRAEQMLARLGSDEFAVLLPGAGAEEAAQIAEQLRAALHAPFDVSGSRLHVAASIGIATAPGSAAADAAGDLLRQADVALHQAQRTRTGQALYDRSGDHGGERLRRTGELRQAVARGDIEVYLQPQIDLRTGVIVGAEALARWRHPHDGVLLPAAFLPLAEHTGLARPMAALVLERALAACASWWGPGRRIPVSVNLGADDLRDEALPGQVSAALQRYGLPAEALRVEITEQTLLTDPAAVADLLSRWRADGVSVSIDDFGTGYSSLAYLSRLPVDEVKLDRTFVADLARPATETIVQHTVAMAHGLGARVVAEGIEDRPTARRLATLGCDVGQGLTFGAALALPAFLDRLTPRSVRPVRPH